MNFRPLYLLLGFALAVSSVKAAPVQDIDRLKPQVDRLVRPLIDGGWKREIAVGVLYKGQSRVWGYGPKGVPAASLPDGDTVFEMASATKLLTKLLVFDLAEKRAVRLDNPASAYLPKETRLPSKGGKKITLLHLINHTSGLPTIPDDMDFIHSDDPYGAYSVDSAGRFLSKARLTQDPGQGMIYSNLGYGLLGLAISQVTGQTYDEVLQQILCKPLGLTATGVVWSPGLLARAAKGIDSEGGAAPYLLSAQPTFIGSGSVHSTVHDLLRLAAAMFDPGAPALGAILGGQTTGAVWGDTIGHGGLSYGFESFVFADRKKKWALVVWGSGANMAINKRLVPPLMEMLKGGTPQPIEGPRFAVFPDASLKPYEGRYQQMEDSPGSAGKKGEIYDIFVRDGHLVSQPAEADRNKWCFDRVGFYTNEEGNFYLKAWDLPASFIRDTNNVVLGMGGIAADGTPNLGTRRLDEKGKWVEGKMPFHLDAGVK